MSNNFKVYHGIKLSAGSKFHNLELEELETDPAVLKLGRVWYNSTDKKYKRAVLSKDNTAIIAKAFDDIDFVSELAVNPIDKFILPENISLNEAVNLLTAELNKIYNKMDNLFKTEYFYINSENINQLEISNKAIKNNISVYINGLSQSNDCFSLINGYVLIFNNLLPINSFIKLEYFNL